MDKVRIGFVGVGTMGQMAHLRNYVTLDDCQVVAIADPRQETARQVAARYGIARVYRDHRELLEAEPLDGVVASQPFRSHAALLPDLYGRVRCVFTEKPLAINVETGRQLAAQAAAAGCIHMVGYHKRSDPATVYARQVIDDWQARGHMGRLRYVRLTMPNGEWIQGGFIGLINAGDKPPASPGEPLPADMSPDVANQYVGFVNYYIHQVNLLRYLLGEPYRVTYADKSGVLLAVESRSGVAGLIEMAPYRTTLAWEESALVGFEKGYIRLELPAPMALNRPGAVEIYADPGDGAVPLRTQPALPWVHAMRQQAIHFIRVCRGQMAPPCDAAEAALDLEAARDYIRLRYGQ